MLHAHVAFPFRWLQTCRCPCRTSLLTQHRSRGVSSFPKAAFHPHLCIHGKRSDQAEQEQVCDLLRCLDT